MYVTLGRFHFRPRSDDERQSLLRVIEEQVPPIARTSSGFRGVYFAEAGEDEVLTVWLFDGEADWEATLPRFGPVLQQHVAPYLSQPPERVGGEVVMHASADSA